MGISVAAVNSGDSGSLDCTEIGIRQYGHLIISLDAILGSSTEDQLVLPKGA